MLLLFPHQRFDEEMVTDHSDDKSTEEETQVGENEVNECDCYTDDDEDGKDAEEEFHKSSLAFCFSFGKVDRNGLFLLVGWGFRLLLECLLCGTCARWGG